MIVQPLRLPLLPLLPPRLLASVRHLLAPAALQCLLRLPAAAVLGLRFAGPSKASSSSTRQLWVSLSSVSGSELDPLTDLLLLLSADDCEG